MFVSARASTQFSHCLKTDHARFVYKAQSQVSTALDIGGFFFSSVLSFLYFGFHTSVFVFWFSYFSFHTSVVVLQHFSLVLH